MKGDLAKAEERLAALDKICRLPCQEYTGLKKAGQRTRLVSRQATSVG